MFTNLAHQLTQLQALDPNQQIFGANGHQYKLYPVSINEILELERDIEIALPAPYRQVLLQVGCGLGPYYGLVCPEQVLVELQINIIDYFQEEDKMVLPSRPFPFTRSDAEALMKNWRRDTGPTYLSATWPCDGYIPIAHQGCGYWSVLVTCGDVAGTVWDVDCVEGYDGMWRPANRPPGIVIPRHVTQALPKLSAPPTFEEWYRGWQDQCFADLEVLHAGPAT